MSARRSLVTGGGGFIGCHLVRLLLERGGHVRVLDIADDLGADDLHHLGANVEILHGSILDHDLVKKALVEVDRLYHLAANPNLWTHHKKDFFETNLEGTRQVLSTAADFDLERIVFTSTESILKSRRRFSGRDRKLIDESITLTLEDMAGAYCRSKFLAEQEAQAWAQRGLPVVIVNPTLPVGPGDRHLTPPSKMLLGFLNGTTPAYLECEMNMIDVRDVALGHILAAEHGQIGHRYILGNENLSLSKVIATLAEITGLPMPSLEIPYPVAWTIAVISEGLSRLTGRPPVAPLTGVRLARTPMSFDCGKAISMLNLPQSPIRGALADAVTWFRDRGLLRRRITVNRR